MPAESLHKEADSYSPLGMQINPDGTVGTNIIGLGEFPTNPIDGQELYLLADAGDGVVWHLKYRAAEPGPYKWYFVGGPPIFRLIDADGSITSTSYADHPATAGPSVVCPRAGDYDVETGMNVTHDSTNSVVQMSYTIAGNPALDADSIEYYSGGGAGPRQHQMRRKRQTGLTRGASLFSKYKVSSGTGHAKRRSIAIWPVRIG